MNLFYYGWQSTGIVIYYIAKIQYSERRKEMNIIEEKDFSGSYGKAKETLSLPQNKFYLDCACLFK